MPGAPVEFLVGHIWLDEVILSLQRVWLRKNVSLWVRGGSGDLKSGLGRGRRTGKGGRENDDLGSVTFTECDMT